MGVAHSFCYILLNKTQPMLQPNAQLARSSLITGLDCGLDRWTGLLDWILKKDVRLACKTACVAKIYASQGHMDVAEPRK